MSNNNNGNRMEASGSAGASDLAEGTRENRDLITYKEWNEADANIAVECESRYRHSPKLELFVLRFPDPEISAETIQGFSPFIDAVHFQQPPDPRHCIVTLKPGANFEKVRDDLSKISFSTGYMKMEIQEKAYELSQNKASEIDPYTLFVGNVSGKVSTDTILSMFPTAKHVDIGYSQKIKDTKYAFIRYDSVEKAVEAYKKTYNIEVESRSIIVRFRRLRVDELNKRRDLSSAREANRDSADKLTQCEIVKGNQILTESDDIDSNVEIIEPDKDNISTIHDDLNSTDLTPSGYINTSSVASTSNVSDISLNIADKNININISLMNVINVNVKREPDDIESNRAVTQDSNINENINECKPYIPGINIKQEEPPVLLGSKCVLLPKRPRPSSSDSDNEDDYDDFRDDEDEDYDSDDFSRPTRYERYLYQKILKRSQKKKELIKQQKMELIKQQKLQSLKQQKI